jgi:hypothetical protein
LNLASGKTLSIVYSSDKPMPVTVQFLSGGRSILTRNLRIEAGNNKVMNINIPQSTAVDNITVQYGRDVGGDPLALFDIHSLQIGASPVTQPSAAPVVAPKQALPPAVPTAEVPVRLKAWNGAGSHARYVDYNPPVVATDWIVNFNWSGPAGRILVRLVREGQSPDSRGNAQEIDVRPGKNTIRLNSIGRIRQLSFNFGPNTWGIDYANGEVSDVTVSTNQAMLSRRALLASGLGFLFVPSAKSQTPVEMRTWTGPRGQSFYTVFNPPITAANWTVRFNWSGPTGKILIRLLRPGQSPDARGPVQEIVVRPGINTVTMQSSGPVKQLSIHTGEAWGVDYANGEVSDVSISNQAMLTRRAAIASALGFLAAPAAKAQTPVELHTWSGPGAKSFYTNFNPPSTATNWTVRFNWSGERGKILIR